MSDESPRVPGRNITGRASEATLEARAYLDRAISRLDELSVVDHDRIAYLEQRSLDDKEATKDLFHTLNNALFVMNVNVELLTRHLTAHGECARSDVKKWLARLTEKSDEMAELNRQLLAGSVRGEGPLYTVHSFISLRAAIQRAIETYDDVAREKSITITWKLPDFPAIAIWTDGVAIGTVLDNLLSNAIKFCQPGTKVEVTMRREGKNLICAVCDEGPGLSQEDMKIVFDRGVMAHPKPTAGESSSGYGLAIARTVIESVGGRLWCESTVGKGSCFIFSLPVTA